MNSKLFFIRQQEGGVESHRWLFMSPDGVIAYSEFYANKAAMVTDCVDTLQRTLLTKDIVFENMKPGMINMLKEVAASRYHDTVNYFDECNQESHMSGCICEGRQNLVEVEKL